MASLCNMKSNFVHFGQWTQMANYAAKFFPSFVAWRLLRGRRLPFTCIGTSGHSGWGAVSIKRGMTCCIIILCSDQYIILASARMAFAISICISIITSTWPCQQGRHVCPRPPLPIHRDDVASSHGYQYQYLKFVQCLETTLLIIS